MSGSDHQHHVDIGMSTGRGLLRRDGVRIGGPADPQPLHKLREGQRDSIRVQLNAAILYRTREKPADADAIIPPDRAVQLRQHGRPASVANQGNLDRDVLRRKTRMRETRRDQRMQPRCPIVTCRMCGQTDRRVDQVSTPQFGNALSFAPSRHSDDIASHRLINPLAPPPQEPEQCASAPSFACWHAQRPNPARPTTPEVHRATTFHIGNRRNPARRQS
jgi:hypothetical protein